MFGKKSKSTIEVTKLSSLIADNLHIVGDLTFSGGLRVDGKIEGNVFGKRGEKSLLVVSDKGCIAGRVCAYDAVIDGTISGDLEVEHFLELQPGAKVSGNITYRQLQMECGATVQGNLVKVDAEAHRSQGSQEAKTDPRTVTKAEAVAVANTKPVVHAIPSTKSAAQSSGKADAESVASTSETTGSAAAAATR